VRQSRVVGASLARSLSSSHDDSFTLSPLERLAVLTASRAMSSAQPPVHVLIGQSPSAPPASTPSNLPFAVGTGAVGAFYGSRLHQPPNTLVSVTCRSNYNAVVANGLTLQTHTFGNYHFQPHFVYPSIQAAADSGIAFDYIVVTTKALPDVTDDSAMIAPLIKDGGRSSIVLIQNGVGVEEPHRTRFPRTPILSAVTIVSAEQTEPGVVRQNRWTRISVGPYVGDGIDGAQALENDSTIQNQRFVRLLKEGGISDAEEYDEKGLQLVRWHKLAVRHSLPRQDLPLTLGID
jgi:2-dehydropantoate 2-reductase